MLVLRPTRCAIGRWRPGTATIRSQHGAVPSVFLPVATQLAPTEPSVCAIPAPPTRPPVFNDAHEPSLNAVLPLVCTTLPKIVKVTAGQLSVIRSTCPPKSATSAPAGGGPG